MRNFDTLIPLDFGIYFILKILYAVFLHMAEKKFSEEVETAFKNVIQLFQGMINDRSVPRNIKRIAQRGIEELTTKKDTPGVSASNVMYMVDDLSQDSNCPFHTRTTIFRIISILEKVKDQ